MAQGRSDIQKFLHFCNRKAILSENTYYYTKGECQDRTAQLDVLITDGWFCQFC